MAIIDAGGAIIPGSGLGTPLRTTSAPTSGTFINVAAKGAILLDVTNAVVYVNTGTQSAPTWTKVGTQS